MLFTLSNYRPPWIPINYWATGVINERASVGAALERKAVMAKTPRGVKHQKEVFYLFFTIFVKPAVFLGFLQVENCDRGAGLIVIRINKSART